MRVMGHGLDCCAPVISSVQIKLKASIKIDARAIDPGLPS